jgi:hypothetical protein
VVESEDICRRRRLACHRYAAILAKIRDFVQKLKDEDSLAILKPLPELTEGLTKDLKICYILLD